MKKIFLLFVIIPLLYSSQIGIKNAVPSSTLAVAGSIEGNYREITATTTLTVNDYHVSFSGSTASVLNLPTMSTTDNSISDFRGRKYYIKNNSTTSNLTLTAVSGQTIRIGGNIAASNTYIIAPGVYGILTANGVNGWDLDLAVNTVSDTSWKLTNNGFNGTLNVAQGIAGTTYQTISGSEVTVTVPSGYAQSRVVLKFDGWGDVTAQAAAVGSLRFQITQAGTSSATYASTTMASWSLPFATASYRYNFPATYSISNLAPGTYTFNLQILRESEAGGTVTLVNIWGIQARAEVYNRN